MSPLSPKLSFGGTEGVEENVDDQIPGRPSENSSFIEGVPLSQHKSSSQELKTSRLLLEDTEDSSPCFELGDHVYKWSKMSQQHGIVLMVDSNDTMLISDFSATPIGVSEASRGQTETGFFRFTRELISATKWKKVSYGVTKWERATKPPGTCSCSVADNPQTIIDRINFLILHHDLIPSSHAMAYSETLASWCCTGEWRALQLNHLLNVSNAVSVVGTGSVATVATAEGVGLCSGMGICSLLGVEATLAAPIVLPAVAIGSIAIGGATVWNSHRMRQEWKQTTKQLNQSFDRFQLLNEEDLLEGDFENLEVEPFSQPLPIVTHT